MRPVRGFAKLKNPKKLKGNSSVTRVTFCNFWTLKSNIIIIYNITFQQPILCVLVDIRILYNMTLTEINLIKDYAFTYI